MDTRYWGPSGWKLLHMAANAYQTKQKSDFKAFFEVLPFILPCKYCRQSLAEYYEEDPLDLSNPLALQKWLYRIHNKVNDKLRNQGDTPNPTFKTVKKQYDEILSLSCSEVDFPGWDFLFSIAETHPSSKLVRNSKPIDGSPEGSLSQEERNKWNLLSPDERMVYFKKFWITLPSIFPYKDWTTLWFQGSLEDRRSTIKWLWKLRSHICKKLNQKNKHTFEGLCNTLKNQRSGCGVSNRGKTCRKKRRQSIG